MNKKLLLSKTLVILSILFATTLIACGEESEEEHERRAEEFQKQYKDQKIEHKPVEFDPDALLKEEDMNYFIDELEIKPEGEAVEIFKIGSDAAVSNGGKNATVTLDNDTYASELWTYHWNDKNGAPAGTIQMLSEDGTVYGPWQATSINTYYWKTTPQTTIPSGNYTIIDSDPATWSQNTETKGEGMTWMLGITQ